MAFDEKLADRIRRRLKTKRGIVEKKMFGGLCFMVNGNMCCGVESDDLVVRVGPKQYENALKRKHARPMDFTGKPLRGFIYVSKDGYKNDAALQDWIELGLNFVATLPTKKSKKR